MKVLGGGNVVPTDGPGFVSDPMADAKSFHAAQQNGQPVDGSEAGSDWSIVGQNEVIAVISHQVGHLGQQISEKLEPIAALLAQGLTGVTTQVNALNQRVGLSQVGVSPRTFKFTAALLFTSFAAMGAGLYCSFTSGMNTLAERMIQAQEGFWLNQAVLAEAGQNKQTQIEHMPSHTKAIAVVSNEAETKELDYRKMRLEEKQNLRS